MSLYDAMQLVILSVAGIGRYGTLNYNSLVTATKWQRWQTRALLTELLLTLQ